MNRTMRFSIDDFDYTLPIERIAQFPAAMRSESRLLIAPEDSTSACIHATFSDILNHMQSGDLMIFNDTRVIPARLFGVKKSGGRIECLIERVLSDHQAIAHIRSSHAPKIGTTIILESYLEATVIDRENGLFTLSFSNPESLWELLEKYGTIPLPPYIAREANRSDLERYQTIYAKNKGAVAAPTAGLHFDDAILHALKKKKVDVGFLTLHVGAGTFQPVRVMHIHDHVMHAERVDVSDTLCEKINLCQQRGGRVIAVGTTVVRALESAAQMNAPSHRCAPFLGETKIFITPGFHFHVVDMLLTNFHLPKSTLLMLVTAFAGYDRVMEIYKTAVDKQYRFFSYGDAMLLHRSLPL